MFGLATRARIFGWRATRRTAKTINLHIGTHKTGSTSLQTFLTANSAKLKRAGYAVYSGMHMPENHIELYLASQRFDRDSFLKARSKKVFDKDYARSVTKLVHAYLDQTAEENVIMSTEGLSLLRCPTEIARLRNLLRADRNRVKVILYLREQASFLESYRAQLLSDPRLSPSTDRKSALYVEPDTWLTDYDSLVSVFRDGFGDGVEVIDYDHEVDKHGDVLPSFLSTLGLSADDFAGSERYFLKQRSRPNAGRECTPRPAYA